MMHNAEEYTLERDNQRFSQWNKEAVERMIPHLSDKRVLDLGCGDGVAIDAFIEHGVECIGVDLNPKKLAHVKAPTACIDYLSYLKKLPNNSVPNIFMHHSLEHVPNPEDVLEQIGRVLKRGGVWFCIVPAELGRELHDTHYAMFDDAAELLPEGLEVITAQMIHRETEEHLMIARKP